MAAAVAVQQPFRMDNERSSSSSSHTTSNNSSSELMNVFESCATSFFGPCEETCQQASRSVFPWDPAASLTGASAQNSINSDHDRIRSLDFETLHDQFLEALLHEAAVLRDDADHETCSQFTNDSSSRHLLRSLSSNVSEETSNSRKRRRPIKLSRRRTPPRIRKQALSDVHSNASTEHSRSSSVTISLSELGNSNLPKPETYLHALVRMQKDKGKGEPVGSNLCAKGLDPCLEKLREKMRLLTEVATESTSASMKIKQARIAERVDNFVETRSLIHLRMGFLSMTYGILLRWDTAKTGTITLVVLRKMCHESFYPDVALVPSSVSTASRGSNASRSKLLQVSEGNNTVVPQRHADLEFCDLEPPYCVNRPEFPNAVLSVTVVSVTGVSKKSNWTASLSMDDSAENVLLQWDSSKRFLSPKSACTLQHQTGNRLKWGPTSAIQIKLYENRIRRRIPRRMTDSLTVPLARLLPQRSPGRPTRITVPCTHDPAACVVLDIKWQSDYAIWATRELQARAQQRQIQAAAIPKPLVAAHMEQEELENHDPWDWICLVC